MHSPLNLPASFVIDRFAESTFGDRIKPSRQPAEAGGLWCHQAAPNQEIFLCR